MGLLFKNIKHLSNNSSFRIIDRQTLKQDKKKKRKKRKEEKKTVFAHCNLSRKNAKFLETLGFETV